MASDLSELIESMRAEVNPPGLDLFPDAVDQDWVQRASNAFWEARLFGFFSGYAELDGLITPDLGRTEQQLIVLFTGATAVRNLMTQQTTVFRATAGPVEFETQQAATLLRDVLKDIQGKVAAILRLLSPLTRIQDRYIDSVFERSQSIAFGNTQWFSSRAGYGSFDGFA